LSDFTGRSFKGIGQEDQGEVVELPSANPSLNKSLIHRLDFLQARDFFQQGPFHALLQGHLGHGAAFAGAGQPHFDDAVDDFHQFDITAVPLQKGADFGQSRFHASLEIFHLVASEKNYSLYSNHEISLCKGKPGKDFGPMLPCFQAYRLGIAMLWKTMAGKTPLTESQARTLANWYGGEYLESPLPGEQRLEMQHGIRLPQCLPEGATPPLSGGETLWSQEEIWQWENRRSCINPNAETWVG
jgi:hypothetical protein